MSNTLSVAVLVLLAAFYMASIWYGLKLARWLAECGNRQIDKWTCVAPPAPRERSEHGTDGIEEKR